MKLCIIITLCVVCALANSDDDTFAFAHVKAPKGADVVFAEVFDDSWSKKWVVSTHPEFNGQWRVETNTEDFTPEISYDSPDKGLVVGSEARKHAISAPFSEILDNTDKDLFIQYEVRLQKGLTCGGAYIKLLRKDGLPKDLKKFNNEVPYTIMFGPDKCGADSKVHFIINHKNPITGEYEEKHMTNRPKIEDDNLTHLYSLKIRSDNTFELEIDQKQVRSGSLFDEFSPAINPPKEIDDPTDLKPSDWVDNAMMPDPDAVKPSDWDESAPVQIADPDDTKPSSWLDDAPAKIPDPSIEKPEDWDDELDGDWEAPFVPNPACLEYGCGKWEPRNIPNPEYRGKWSPPLIANPAYIGEWKARQIANPAYFSDENPHTFEPIGAIGIELWTMSDKILFDNILITHDEDVANNFASQTFVQKKQWENSVMNGENFGFGDVLSSGFGDIFTAVESFIENPDNLPMVAGTVFAIILLPALFIYMSVGNKKNAVKKPATKETTKTKEVAKNNKEKKSKGKK